MQRARELEARQLEDRLRQVAHVDGTADLVGEERHVERPVDGVQRGALDRRRRLTAVDQRRPHDGGSRMGAQNRRLGRGLRATVVRHRIRQVGLDVRPARVAPEHDVGRHVDEPGAGRGRGGRDVAGALDVRLPGAGAVAGVRGVDDARRAYGRDEPGDGGRVADVEPEIALGSVHRADGPGMPAEDLAAEVPRTARHQDAHRRPTGGCRAAARAGGPPSRAPRRRRRRPCCRPRRPRDRAPAPGCRTSGGRS